MKRLTTDNPENNLQTALNLFYAKEGEAWVRGSGPDGQDITLNECIRQAIRQQIPCHLQGIADFGDAELSEVMCDWAMDGPESLEGWLGMLYTAGWVCAELRARLKEYEDSEQLQLEERLLEVPCKIGTQFHWGKAENVWTVTGYYFSDDGEKSAYIEKNGIIRMMSIARLADILSHAPTEGE